MRLAEYLWLGKTDSRNIASKKWVNSEQLQKLCSRKMIEYKNMGVEKYFDDFSHCPLGEEEVNSSLDGEWFIK